MIVKGPLENNVLGIYRCYNNDNDDNDENDDNTDTNIYNDDNKKYYWMSTTITMRIVI